MTKPSRGGGRPQNDVVVTQPVSVLTRPWSTTVETRGIVMEWWTKFEGKERESCIQGRRVTKVAGERWAFHQRHCPRVDTRARRSRRQCCRGVERIRASQSCCGIFPTGRVVSVLWEGGRPQGVSGARCGLRHDRVGRCTQAKGEGTKRRERVAGKAAGDECVFIPGEGARAGRLGRVPRHAGRGGR